MSNDKILGFSNWYNNNDHNTSFQIYTKNKSNALKIGSILDLALQFTLLKLLPVLCKNPKKENSLLDYLKASRLYSLGKSSRKIITAFLFPYLSIQIFSKLKEAMSTEAVLSATTIQALARGYLSRHRQKSVATTINNPSSVRKQANTRWTVDRFSMRTWLIFISLFFDANNPSSMKISDSMLSAIIFPHTPSLLLSIIHPNTDVNSDTEHENTPLQKLRALIKTANDSDMKKLMPYFTPLAAAKRTERNLKNKKYILRTAIDDLKKDKRLYSLQLLLSPVICKFNSTTLDARTFALYVTSGLIFVGATAALILSLRGYFYLQSITQPDNVVKNFEPEMRTQLKAYYSAILSCDQKRINEASDWAAKTFHTWPSDGVLYEKPSAYPPLWHIFFGKEVEVGNKVFSVSGTLQLLGAAYIQQISWQAAARYPCGSNWEWPECSGDFGLQDLHACAVNEAFNYPDCRMTLYAYNICDHQDAWESLAGIYSSLPTGYEDYINKNYLIIIILLSVALIGALAISIMLYTCALICDSQQQWQAIRRTAEELKDLEKSYDETNATCKQWDESKQRINHIRETNQATVEHNSEQPNLTTENSGSIWRLFSKSGGSLVRPTNSRTETKTSTSDLTLNGREESQRLFSHDSMAKEHSYGTCYDSQVRG